MNDRHDKLAQSLTLRKDQLRQINRDTALSITFVVALTATAILLIGAIVYAPVPWDEESVNIGSYFGLRPQGLMVIQLILGLISLIIGTYYVYHRYHRNMIAKKLELVYEQLAVMAKGQYDQLIPEEDLGVFTGVVQNINKLVTSIVKVLDEERQVEQSKDELIANVGHDLRTPLTAIIGYLGLIENNQCRDVSDMMRYTHKAYDRAVMMQNLVNDLFEYSVSGSSTFKLTYQDMGIQFFLEQMAVDFELEAAQAGVEIMVAVKPPQAVFTVDPEKMSRVYNNLISNALKYGKGANYIRLMAFQTSGKIILEVANDGELMAPELTQMVFQRSFRADSARTSKVAGAGLGLAIVQNIVKAHGGTIQALVEQDETKFRIILPDRLLQPPKELDDGEME